MASSSPGAEEEEQEKEERSTKKPAMVPLLEDMTAMQIDCGTFHTGIHAIVTPQYCMYSGYCLQGAKMLKS